MNRKQVALIIGICFLASLPYLLTPIMSGVDSYYFLNYLWGKDTPYSFETDPLAQIVFDVLPANIFLLKLLLFGLLTGTTLIISLTGELINKRSGWLAGPFCFFSLVWINYFARLENDVFAYPLLALSLYFLIKSKKNKLWGLVSFACIALACLFWQASALFFITNSAVWIFSLAAAIPLIIWKWETILNLFTPTLSYIQENQAIIGILNQNILLIGIIGIPTYLLFPTLFYFILAGMRAKYAILLIPFLALGLVQFVDKHKEKIPRYIWIILFITAIGMSIYSLNRSLPDQGTFELIDYAIQTSQDLNKPFVNNWSYGYWVAWRDGTPTEWGSGFYDKPQDYNHAIGISYVDLNCQQLKEHRILKVYNCE